jgi:hypothetical protein
MSKKPMPIKKTHRVISPKFLIFAGIIDPDFDEVEERVSVADVCGACCFSLFLGDRFSFVELVISAPLG